MMMIEPQCAKLRDLIETLTGKRLTKHFPFHGKTRNRRRDYGIFANVDFDNFSGEAKKKKKKCCYFF